MGTIDVGVYDENAIFALGVAAVLRDDPMVRNVSTDLAAAPRVDVAVTSIALIGHGDISSPIVACMSNGDVPPAAPEQHGVVALLDRDHTSPDQLCSAIHAAAAGLRIHWDGQSSNGTLDERSCAVLRLLAAGADTREISTELGYSERTIKGILQEVTRRFGLRNRSHAVAYAVRRGLI